MSYTNAIREAKQLIHNARFDSKEYLADQDKISWEAEMILEKTLEMLNLSEIIISNKGLWSTFVVGDLVRCQGKTYTLYAPDKDGDENDKKSGRVWWKGKSESGEFVFFSNGHIDKIVCLSPARFYHRRIHALMARAFDPESNYSIDKHDVQLIEAETELVSEAVRKELIVWDETALLGIAQTELGKLVYEHWNEIFDVPHLNENFDYRM